MAQSSPPSDHLKFGIAAVGRPKPCAYAHPQTTYGLIERFDRANPDVGPEARQGILGGNIVRLLEERRTLAS